MPNLHRWIGALLLSAFLGLMSAVFFHPPLHPYDPSVIPLLEQEKQHDQIVFNRAITVATIVFVSCLLFGKIALSETFRHAAWGACAGVLLAVVTSFVLAGLRGELRYRYPQTAFELGLNFRVPALAVVEWGVGATWSLHRSRQNL